MKTINEFWTRRSRQYNNRIEGVLLKSVPKAVNHYLHDWMISEVKSVFKNYTLKVLDIGCGYGRLSKQILKEYPKSVTFGVDIAERYIDLYNQELAPRGKAFLGDMQKLPFKDSYFDVVFVVTTLMYLTKASEQENALKEMLRVLKPGGYFIVIERNPVGYSIFTLGGLVSKIRGKKHSEIPAVSFSPCHLRQLTARSGGKVNICHGIPVFTLFFPVVLLLSLLNLHLGRFFLRVIKYTDKKLNRLYLPSLYISYIGKKE